MYEDQGTNAHLLALAPVMTSDHSTGWCHVLPGTPEKGATYGKLVCPVNGQTVNTCVEGRGWTARV